MIAKSTRRCRSSIYRAVIFAIPSDADAQHTDSLPCLVLLGDRPALHHAIDTAVRSGAKRIEIIAHSHIDAIRDSVGQGELWGVAVSITTIPTAASSSQITGSCLTEMRAADRVLFLDAHRFPCDVPTYLDGQSKATQVWCADGRWAGASCGVVARLRDGFREARDSEEPGQVFLRFADDCIETIPVDVSTGADLLATQARLLDGRLADLVAHLQPARPGLWVGRDSRVHETAKLHSPVLIGEGCQVGAHAVVGPNVVIGDGSIISDGVGARDSLVTSKCYVGNELQLKDVVLSPSRLYNARLDAALDVYDEHLVADLGSPCFRTNFQNLVSRSVGGILAIMTWPLLAMGLFVLTVLLRRPRFRSREVLQTPAHRNEVLWRCVSLPQVSVRPMKSHQRPTIPHMWRDLFVRVLPGLRAVMRGDIRLLGTTSHTVEKFRSMPNQWRPMLQDQPGGLISEALVQFGPQSSLDRASMADVYYVMTDSQFKRMDLLRRYCVALIRGPENRRNSIAGTEDCVTHTRGVTTAAASGTL